VLRRDVTYDELTDHDSRHLAAFDAMYGLFDVDFDAFPSRLGEQ
jgi:hypothetical protein